MADDIKQEQAVTEAVGTPQDTAAGPAPVAVGTTTPSAEAVSAGADQVQSRMDEENAVGYRGHNPSPVPNSHYTVAGVLAGKPTPETDQDMAVEVHRTLRFGTLAESAPAAVPDSGAAKKGK